MTRNRWQTALYALLSLGLIVVAVTFRDYGVSYDDEYSRYHGADFIRWYASGFSNRSIMSRAANEYIYSHFFTGPATAFAAISPLRPYDSTHLASALVALIGLFAAFSIGRELGGHRAGFLSALVLALTPAYYGHAFINSKDLPFAVFYLVALYAILRLYDRLPRPGARRIITTGIAVGLPLSIRVGGVMVIAYTGALIALWHLAAQPASDRSRLRESLRNMRHTVPAFAAIVVIAWVIMLFWWPWAQLDPIANPLYALTKSVDFDGAGFMNLYRGEFIRSSLMPRGYLPVMLAATLPEFYALGIAASVAAVIQRAARGNGSAGTKAAGNAIKLGFFAFIALAPVAMAVILRPTVYDGTRLFLFAIPPLAVIAALGINWFFSLALPVVVRRVAAALLVFAMGLTVADMILIHPYQYTYFNRMSGGLTRAYGRFDTDYWGTSHKEGIDWLVRNYKQGAPERSITVGNPSNAFLTAYYIEPGTTETRRFTHADMKDNPDVILAMTRWNQHLRYSGRVLHVVERMGTPLLYVIESSSRGTAEDSTMKRGLERLYYESDPAGSMAEFNKVLEANPAHYGATVALATALDRSNRSAEARALWTRVLELATRFSDERTADVARQRLR